MGSLLRRLKERKLVQWTIAYLAGAWVVFEASDVVGGHLGWPELLYQGLLVVLGLGFLVTLVLAWYHGEQGRQTVSGPELTILAVLLLIAGGVLSTLQWSPQTPPASDQEAVFPPDTERPAIAVLPCDNISPDPADAYLAEGIHEEILLRLQRIPTLLSIGRTSVLRYAQDPPPVDQIGSRLQVGFVGECSVRRDRDRIRMTFQLLNAASGEQLWAENYDRILSAGDLFDMQSAIAKEIAVAMSGYLAPGTEFGNSGDATENDLAYDLYMRGRAAHHTLTLDGLLTAIRYFEDALDLDPGFALAYAGIADSYIVSAHRGVASHEAFPQAERAARRAIALDSALAAPRAALADTRYHYYWDWTGAEEGFRGVLELDPDHATANTWYAGMLAAMGRFDEAIEHMTRAERTDPFSHNTQSMYSRILYYSGQYGRAAAAALTAMESDPDNARLGIWPALAAIQEAGGSEAMSLLESLPGPGTSSAEYLSARIQALSAANRSAEARERISELEAMATQTYVRPHLVALGYAALGDPDSAFAWLERAYKERDAQLIWVNVDPGFASLRSDPRFEDLLARINLNIGR